MSTVAKVLAEARKHLGYYKKPGTETKFGIFYANLVGNRVYRNAQWCAIFITYIAHDAGAAKIIPAHAYTPSGVNWWKSQGQWHAGLSGVRAGDIVYFDFPGAPDRVSHVAIVESVNSDGSVNTIEGNTSSFNSGDQRNSGTCARKRRKAYIVGFGRPKYSGAPASGSGSTNVPNIIAGVHIVRKGETLSQIAKLYETTVAAFVATNGIKDANVISVGQKLKVPKATTLSKPAPTPSAAGWYTVTGVGKTNLMGRSGPSTKHRILHRRKQGFHLYIAKTVKSGGTTWGVTNYGTHYSMKYLKKGKK